MTGGLPLSARSIGPSCQRNEVLPHGEDAWARTDRLRAFRGIMRSFMAGLDRLARPLRNLRLSVTDRCNLRCGYCMPEESYVWLRRQDILDFEEIARLADAFIALGVEKIRLTGGEPLLRRDLAVLVRLLATKPGVRDLALTTNAIRLGEQAEELRAAGLKRLTISLDTLERSRFERLTRRDALSEVLDGIAAARSAGFRGTKLNAVVQRGFNDDELGPLLEFGREQDLEVRFIEYMDVGGATRWSMDEVVSRQEMLTRLTQRFGEIAQVASAPSAPADRFRLRDGTVFGIIASTTEPFCSACDRSRLTADGMWYTCLYAPNGTDLRAALRAGASTDELASRILGVWRERDDRGAEERSKQGRKRTSFDETVLRENPHFEMHTRGG